MVTRSSLSQNVPHNIRIPHFTTLQKFMERITGTVMQRMITCFIILPFVNVKNIFFGIDSSGFKSTHSLQYYTERIRLRKRKKWTKLSVGADVLKHQKPREDWVEVFDDYDTIT